MNANETLTGDSRKPVDSFRTTEEIVKEVDIAIRALGHGGGGTLRTHLFHWRTAIAKRVQVLERRLNDGDAWFREHAPGMRPTAEAWTKAERHWMTLLQEYERAFDAMERADAALTGGIPA